MATDNHTGMAVTDAHVYCLPGRLRQTQTDFPAANDAIRRAIHGHPDAPSVLPLSSPDAIVASMDSCGISRSAIVSFPWASLDLCVENNRFLLDTCKRQSRFSAICAVQPLDPEWQREAERCLAMGAVGLKVNAGWQGFELDGKEMRQLAGWAAKNKMFLMVHVDQGFKKSHVSAAHFLALVDQCPETRFLAAHLGGLLGLYAPFGNMASRLHNVWFDTAISATLYMVRYYIDCGLAKKIVFGSDFPFNHSHQQAQVIEGLIALGLGAEIERAIFSGNYKDLIEY